MYRQIHRLLFIIVLFHLPVLLLGYQRIPKPLSERIIDFSLYNFDNLIADSYEGTSLYQNQLLFLLSQSTGTSETSLRPILNHPDLITEVMPTRYMVKLNLHLKTQTGFDFVDD